MAGLSKGSIRPPTQERSRTSCGLARTADPSAQETEASVTQARRRASQRGDKGQRYVRSQTMPPRQRRLSATTVHEIAEPGRMDGRPPSLPQRFEPGRSTAYPTSTSAPARVVAWREPCRGRCDSTTTCARRDALKSVKPAAWRRAIERMPWRHGLVTRLVRMRITCRVSR